MPPDPSPGDAQVLAEAVEVPAANPFRPVLPAVLHPHPAPEAAAVGAGRQEVVERRELRGTDPLEQERIVLRVRVGVADQKIEEEGIEKPQDDGPGRRSVFPDQSRALGDARSSFRLVLHLRRPSARLAEVLLVNAVDGRARRDAVEALDQEGLEMIGPFGHSRRHPQARLSRQRHAVGLVGDEAIELRRRDLDDVRAGGPAPGDPHPIVLDQDGQLVAGPSERQPHPLIVVGAG